MAKFLLFIQGTSERSIDECLVIVPDDFDKAEVLQAAEDGGISGAYIVNKFEIDVPPFAEVASDYRLYIG